MCQCQSTMFEHLHLTSSNIYLTSLPKKKRVKFTFHVNNLSITLFNLTTSMCFFLLLSLPIPPTSLHVWAGTATTTDTRVLAKRWGDCNTGEPTNGGHHRWWMGHPHQTVRSSSPLPRVADLAPCANCYSVIALCSAFEYGHRVNGKVRQTRQRVRCS